MSWIWPECGEEKKSFFAVDSAAAFVASAAANFPGIMAVRMENIMQNVIPNLIRNLFVCVWTDPESRFDRLSDRSWWRGAASR